jgi:hypothetical protein
MENVAIDGPISEPLYINENGPYYVSLDSKTTPCHVYLYEVLDTSSFVCHSVKLSSYITTELFIRKALKTMHLPAREILREGYRVTHQRIVADAPVCRRTLERISHTYPEVAALTFIMTSSGELLTAQKLSEHPELLQ